MNYLFKINANSLLCGITLFLIIIMVFSFEFINPFYPLLFSIGISTIIICIIFPSIMLGFVTFYIPMEAFILAFIPTDINKDIIGLGPELILISLLFSLLLNFFKNKKKLHLNFIDHLLIILISWSLVTSILSEVNIFHMVNGFRVLFRFVLVYVACRLIWDPFKSWRKLVNTLYFFIFFEVILGIVQSIGKRFSPTTWNLFGENPSNLAHTFFGVQGTLIRYDQYGTFLAIAGLVMFSNYINISRKNNKYLLAFVLTVIGIILSTSRQALVFIILGALILFLLSNIKHKKFKFKYYILTVGFFGSFLYIALSQFNGGNIIETTGRNPFELLTSLFEKDTFALEKTTNFRLYYLFYISPLLIKEHFWGMGLGTFGSVFSRETYLPIYQNMGLYDNFLSYIADVNWVSIIGQIGIFGTLLFLFFFISVSRKSLKYLKRSSDDEEISVVLSLAIAISIGFVVLGFLGPNYEIRTTSFYLWFLLGIANRFMIDSKKFKD
ncbi:O-antigen ligase family protein [Rossellomorea vietnamensis]|uniref:O-antigen ligase family protein n=1 Tax=Rossellomorea vietnamensis TaxID=218284 RepID=UPI003D279656